MVWSQKGVMNIEIDKGKSKGNHGTALHFNRTDIKALSIGRIMGHSCEVE